jgi:hypothetical protein
MQQRAGHACLPLWPLPQIIDAGFPSTIEVVQGRDEHEGGKSAGDHHRDRDDVRKRWCEHDRSLVMKPR